MAVHPPSPSSSAAISYVPRASCSPATPVYLALSSFGLYHIQAQENKDIPPTTFSAAAHTLIPILEEANKRRRFHPHSMSSVFHRCSYPRETLPSLSLPLVATILLSECSGYSAPCSQSISPFDIPLRSRKCMRLNAYPTSNQCAETPIEMGPKLNMRGKISEPRD